LLARSSGVAGFPRCDVNLFERECQANLLERECDVNLLEREFDVNLLEREFLVRPPTYGSFHDSE
jgi:hypothetical protein